MSGGPYDIARLLDELAGADVPRRERVCDGLARSAVEQQAVPHLVLASPDPADPGVLFAERYWQRTLLRRPTLTAASACGVWIAGHVLARHREQLLERWLLRAGQHSPPASAEAPVDGFVADALTQLGTTPAEGLSAAVLYRAGQLQQRGAAAAAELASWLTHSPLATALRAESRQRRIHQALLAWAAFWDPGGASRADGQLLWSTAWRTALRDDPVVTEILLAALASPHHRAAAGPPPRGELLAAADRLAHYAAHAVQAHPAAHELHYWHTRGLRESGHPRAAQAALRTAQRLLPHHPGADPYEQRLNDERRLLPRRLRTRRR
ncbi:hypothetical protein [Streptomyces armeniacus]|uniref:hypothetical protein n=1 Tax=Streptomyces armeniacus TaxID=83291 RepID=UPI001AD84BE6|nr:hypothetical protein [Streptomyces armeniacus]